MSPDGITWTDLTLRLAVDIGPDQWAEGAPDPGFADVATLDDHVVIVGRQVSGPMVWWGSLEDGIQQVADRAVFADATVAAVTATPAGFVAVGNAVHGVSVWAAVWTSADGSTWTRVPEQGTLGAGVAMMLDVGGELIAGGMRAVAPGGPGVVAVGATCDEAGTCTAATWWSADGSTWARGNVAGTAGGMGSVASGPAGIVAIAGTDVLVSPDGRTWTAQALAPEVGSLEHVAAAEDGFYAQRPSRPEGSTAPVPGLLVSRDGTTWEEVLAMPLADAKRSYVRGADLVASPEVLVLWWDMDAAWAITRPSAP